jgi:hypothetical protein
LKEDWRWDDRRGGRALDLFQFNCTIIPRGDHRVVQFSHFSVKEYLTSPRLAQSPYADVSRFRIDLEPAHTIMAQACLATLLRLDESAGKRDAKVSPLVEYAAQHWVDHAQFEEVSSRVREGMDDLFDSSKPYFAAWLQMHNIEYNIDEDWYPFSSRSRGIDSPLYYAVFCGFYDLAERLIMKHPDQVNARGGRILFPLPAALYKRHFHVADLLYRHGAVVDVQGDDRFTPLHAASCNGQVDIMRWLIDHGADTNSRDKHCMTPLIQAAVNGMNLEAVQLLLEHNADTDSQYMDGKTSLSLILRHRDWEGQVVDIFRRLLEHGADPNIPDKDHRTALHEASSRGLLDAARLLLSYGVKIDEKDSSGRTPIPIGRIKRTRRNTETAVRIRCCALAVT